jgi:2-amino-4-hydroxy-6-hydroxymethyldihydropteridine diphosphokinase
MEVVFLSLGSNLGNREKNLRKAIKLLKKKVQVEKISGVYLTEPVGRIKQADFFNIAVKAKTNLGPLQLLEACKGIERKLKRQRSIKWGPRTIDVDILFFGKEKIVTAGLTIPHKELAKRRFVLLPLSEIAPGLKHPATGKTIKQLLRMTKDKKTAIRIGKL